MCLSILVIVLVGFYSFVRVDAIPFGVTLFLVAGKVAAKAFYV